MIESLYMEINLIKKRKDLIKDNLKCRTLMIDYIIRSMNKDSVLQSKECKCLLAEYLLLLDIILQLLEVNFILIAPSSLSESVLELQS
jgi:hypothetical protein